MLNDKGYEVKDPLGSSENIDELASSYRADVYYSTLESAMEGGIITALRYIQS